MSTERTFALTCWAGPHPAPQALSSPKPLAQHTTHKPHVTTHPCQSAHTRLSGASAAAARCSCSSHNTRCSAAPRGHTSHTVHNTPCAKLVLLPSRAAGIAASSRPPHFAAYDLQSLKVVHSSTKDSAPFASMRGSSSATSCASAFNAEANPPRMSTCRPPRCRGCKRHTWQEVVQIFPRASWRPALRDAPRPRSSGQSLPPACCLCRSAGLGRLMENPE